MDDLAGTLERLPARERRRHGGHGVVLPPGHALLGGFAAEVEQLEEAEDQGDERRHQHEPDDDRLLRGPGEEAVHLVRAGEAGANVARVQGEAVEVVLTHQEQHLQYNLGHEMDGVATEEATSNADLAVALDVLGDFVGPEEQTGLLVQVRLLLYSLVFLYEEEENLYN